VLIINSWWGLTSSFIRLADHFADCGLLAGCVDIYGGATATTEAQARRLRHQKRSEPIYRTLQRCLQILASDDQSAEFSPAVVGFSMGSHWAVWLAQHPNPQVSAAVLFYGARGGDFSGATASVIAHFADVDEFVSAAARRRMERAIASRGLSYTSYDYPGTKHWFAEPAHPSFDAGAAELAIDRTVGFLTSLDPA
jgi:carboxymethylenebutenolidase